MSRTNQEGWSPPQRKKRFSGAPGAATSASFSLKYLTGNLPSQVGRHLETELGHDGRSRRVSIYSAPRMVGKLGVGAMMELPPPTRIGAFGKSRGAGGQATNPSNHPVRVT